ncbi:hypothetical protein TRICI_006059 [Trichomonascus ciferrii]|uniref:UBC core domain-containing protein n=1 Tax=Trichomonascus ciferrii TaxID=44093 RepID=A0A642UM73_9ASCO|nr:hypothetical protein TRICI_006059 [Trichomonascus ciferrii]
MAANRRLLKELAAYQADPNPALQMLEPESEEDMFTWTGEVCLDVLKSQWTPAWTLSSALTAVQAMLSDPEPDSPLNIDAANLVRCGDQSAYDGIIRYYTVVYARRKPL